MEVPPALVVFCRREYPRIVGSLRLYTGDALLAEELAQDTFVRVCRDWERVSRMDSPGAWTQRVALNLVRSRHRRRRAEGRMQARVASRSSEADWRDGVLDPSTVTALLRLPPDERAVLILRFYADLSVTQTAEILDWPEGTVKSRTRRALTSLRESGLLREDLSDVP